MAPSGECLRGNGRDYLIGFVSNLCLRHTYQKLVPETGTSFLVPVIGKYVMGISAVCVWLLSPVLNPVVLCDSIGIAVLHDGLL